MKWKPDERKTTTIVFFILMAVLALTPTLISVNHDIFWSGYHNMDSGHNWAYLNAEHNLNLIDYYDGDDYYTPKESYMKGIDGMFQAYQTIWIGWYLVGACTTALLFIFIQTLDKAYPKGKK